MSLSAAGSLIVCLTSEAAEILPLRMRSSACFTAATSADEVVVVTGAATDCRTMIGCESALARTRAGARSAPAESGRGRGRGSPLPEFAADAVFGCDPFPATFLAPALCAVALCAVALCATALGAVALCALAGLTGAVLAGAVCTAALLVVPFFAVAGCFFAGAAACFL